MFRSMILSCIVVGAMTLPAGAVLIDFNAPTYSDGAIDGQADWTGGVGLISVENTATNGRLVLQPTGAGTAQLNLTTPVVPGPDGKIFVSFDVIEGPGAESGFISQILFGDAAGNSLVRLDGQKASVRPRDPLGRGRIATTMSVGGGEASVRTLWIEIDTTDTTDPVNGETVGGEAFFYQDSISPGNLLGSLIYPLSASDEIGRVSIVVLDRSGELDDNRGLIDNIRITVIPEPSSVLLLAVGTLAMFVGLRRRRR